MVHYGLKGPETVKVQAIAEYYLYCRDDNKVSLFISHSLVLAYLRNSN